MKLFKQNQYAQIFFKILLWNILNTSRIQFGFDHTQPIGADCNQGIIMTRANTIVTECWPTIKLICATNQSSTGGTLI